ncbi:unnamed protein product [Rotaria sordida]|uniref:Reverse transcriptase domain-containing protein n=1 Tax=Rotaria sordida TaxID=392033 RepID=A0A819DJK3_9BILA|nr:unnamed protein product [Rotaria sordida]CAF3824826.1 unnamed protein product [Rotaria sordida]
MADDFITFEVISVVKIFIELNQIKTKIVVNVVNSLYTDCILEMGYINKYQVNLNNKQEQVQVYISTDYIMLPMEAQGDNIRIYLLEKYYIPTVRKHDSSYRFIVDYRKLHCITIQDNFSLPNLEQAIQMIDGHQYYTKLDLLSGYFQISILEEDKHKATFITTHGLYEFNVVMKDLKHSSPSFQRIISNLLLPYQQFRLVYLNNLLIYSNSFKQHIDHLNQVLAILNKHEFQHNPQKYELSGINLLQEQIDKALAIPQPTSLNQTNAFISAVGLYQKFIKDYAKLPAPILKVANN